MYKCVDFGGSSEWNMLLLGSLCVHKKCVNNKYIKWYGGYQYKADWLSSFSLRHLYCKKRVKTQIIPLYFGYHRRNRRKDMEKELKEGWLTRTVRLIKRYAPCAKAQNAQWAYLGRDMFYYVFQKVSFCEALRSLTFNIDLQSIRA